jgi:hypothetical protein
MYPGSAWKVSQGARKARQESNQNQNEGEQNKTKNKGFLRKAPTVRRDAHRSARLRRQSIAAAPHRQPAATAARAHSSAHRGPMSRSPPAAAHRRHPDPNAVGLGGKKNKKQKRWKKARIFGQSQPEPTSIISYTHIHPRHTDLCAMSVKAILGDEE